MGYFKLFALLALISSLPASVFGAVAAAPVSTSFYLQKGTATLQESWMIDSDSGSDVLRGHVEFAPNATAPLCGVVRMVQVARVEVTPGVDYDWTSLEVVRNQIRTAANTTSGVSSGFYLDHQAGKCTPGKPCSPYFRDFWANAEESQDGVISKAKVQATSLVDYPTGWDLFQRITLETCARCTDSGAYLGCMNWGGDWPSIGVRSFLPVKGSDSPSSTFLEAVRLFNLFYGN